MCPAFQLLVGLRSASSIIEVTIPEVCVAAAVVEAERGVEGGGGGVCGDGVGRLLLLLMY